MRGLLPLCCGGYGDYRLGIWDKDWGLGVEDWASGHLGIWALGSRWIGE